MSGGNRIVSNGTKESEKIRNEKSPNLTMNSPPVKESSNSVKKIKKRKNSATPKRSSSKKVSKNANKENRDVNITSTTHNASFSKD